MKLAVLTLAAIINPVFAGDLLQTNDTKFSGPVPLAPLGFTNQPGAVLPENRDSGWSNSFAGSPRSSGLSLAGGRTPPGPGLFGESPLALPDFKTDRTGPRGAGRGIFSGESGDAGSHLGSTNLWIYTNPPPHGIPRRMPPPLAPGVYLTRPYTCIVIAPGPHPDDISLGTRGGDWVEAMPTVNPELEFIPYSPAERQLRR